MFEQKSIHCQSSKNERRKEVTFATWTSIVCLNVLLIWLPWREFSECRSCKLVPVITDGGSINGFWFTKSRLVLTGRAEVFRGNCSITEKGDLGSSDSIGETGRLFQEELWSLVVKLENRGDWIVGSEGCWHSIVRDKEGRWVSW